MNGQGSLLPAGTYRHSKTGNLYRVIGAAIHTETGEKFAVYAPLYDCEVELFVRPLDMFLGSAAVNGEQVARFVKLDEDTRDC